MRRVPPEERIRTIRKKTRNRQISKPDRTARMRVPIRNREKSHRTAHRARTRRRVRTIRRIRSILHRTLPPGRGRIRKRATLKGRPERRHLPGKSPDSSLSMTGRKRSLPADRTSHRPGRSPVRLRNRDQTVGKKAVRRRPEDNPGPFFRSSRKKNRYLTGI